MLSCFFSDELLIAAKPSARKPSVSSLFKARAGIATCHDVIDHINMSDKDWRDKQRQQNQFLNVITNVNIVYNHYIS